MIDSFVHKFCEKLLFCFSHSFQLFMLYYLIADEMDSLDIHMYFWYLQM